MPPLMSISYFFLLRINSTNIVTKLIVDFLNWIPEFHQNDVRIDVVDKSYL